MSAVTASAADAGDASRSWFATELGAGDILHIWQKPVHGSAASCVSVRDAAGGETELIGPPSDDFQMIALTISVSGKTRLEWDGAGTAVSVCYAFNPARVFDEGIRVLWAAAPARASRSRFRLHYAPPFGWMNDPNGLIEIGGRTHLFFQHYPHAHRWDTMHWGHAVSGNLVDWIDLPVFLLPPAKMLAEPGKIGGAFSGSAIARAGGGLRIFHTDREDGRQPEQEWQMTAISQDCLSAGPSAAVIDTRPPLPGFGRDLRDPYVFKGPDGLWKMVLGGADSTAALVLLYETDDETAATGWRFSGVLHREPLARAVPAECPCLIALDGEGQGLHALVFGLVGHQTPVNGRLNPSYALVGRFDGRRFIEVARRELDFAGDYYAFQSFTYEGRPVGIAWAANWAYVRRTHDFLSCTTFARRLVWRDGVLFMPPVESVSDLRVRELATSASDLARDVGLPSGLAEVAIEFDRAEAFRITLAHPQIPLALVYENGLLELTGDWVRPRAKQVRHAVETPPPLRISIYVDVGLVEIFVDDGRLCATKRIDSDVPFSAVRLESDAATAATVWQLRPANPDNPRTGAATATEG